MATGTLDDWVERDVVPLVDPEARAHVYNLVSAVGGAGDDGGYALGDDALACLKDLKRWLQFFENKLNRRDVARCMAEANLVKGDLLPILAKISDKVTTDKLKHRIAIACLELLVPLTWPTEIDPSSATVNHHRHGPYLQLAQIGYKRGVLQYDAAKILQTTVRIALPSMLEPRKERTVRDEAIIRIVLYFVRNIVMLSQPKGLPADGDEAEISRSAAIDACHSQDIFQMLLTISSSMGDEFVLQDVVVLEILFHLVKGVDAEKLFMEEKKLSTKNTEELKDLIQKEKAMLAGYARHAPTRHNRFGTMIWVKRDDERVSTISGQDVLGKAQVSMQKMDKTKKWNKPRNRGPRKDDEASREEFDLPVPLTSSGRKHLKAFVEDFLDSSFNPLFIHLRRAIEREEERVESRHSRQYFYLISWFLRAECARRRQIKEKFAKSNDPTAITAEDESFGLIAGVMNQETFILLNRFMQRSMDEKTWQDLNAGMKCFTQILHTVQEMSEAALEEDQEIAENIQNRIFYEESTHERIIAILRGYKDQGFGYLDACTELSHVFLRMLERYSKQNLDLQVRSRRRARKKRKVPVQPEEGEENRDDAVVSENEELQEAQRTTSERKFDFARFAAKFMNQSCVNTFVSFTRFYNDLNVEQLKRAHRFFYKVAFKVDMSVFLYRVDILQLFNKMIKGPEGLDPDLPAFKEWEEFVKHFFRTAVKKIQERPELVVEMLFSKINATTYYLQHGYDKEVVTRTPRAPAELEVKGGMEKADQIGVAVGVLLNQAKSDALKWLKDIMSSAADERKSWEDMEDGRKAMAESEAQPSIEGDEAPAVPEDEEGPKAPPIVIKPDNEERRIALYKDNKLRLLMTLLGFLRLGLDTDMEANWIIPHTLTASDLKEAVNLIQKFEFDPPIYEDGKAAEDFLRSKAAARRRRASFDDDSEGAGGSQSEDHGEYGALGPTATKSDALEELKKRRRRRRRSGTPRELDDEEKERRKEARRLKDLEKQAKHKSTMFVHDSDDDSDEERDRIFFEREEELRKATGRDHVKGISTEKSKKPASKKRKSAAEPTKGRKKRKGASSDSEENESEEDVIGVSSRASSVAMSDRLASDEEENTDTPISSQHHEAGQVSDEDVSGLVSKATVPVTDDAEMADDDDEDDDDIAPVRRPVARRMRAGFVIDSDSE
ncbi:timeless-domain-containing protein [Lophium mytilinum]|uniref:Topoisomerase 1-associated factor 1 n=1 Tax=Lophium mytilinum TaxID=390894 RepID=A0A6A6R9K0_9PEZI|nr:timeless-domain-containing protein [Lophium mytilinum]